MPVKVDLTPELERLVASKIRPGGFSSAADVVGEALRLLDERDRFLLLRKKEIRKKIADGLESLRQGRGLDGEAVFDRMEAELDSLARAGHK